MTKVTLELPDEVFSALRRSPEEFVAELRLAGAIHWYERGVISQEKAAHIAGLDRTDFLMALTRDRASRKLRGRLCGGYRRIETRNRSWLKNQPSMLHPLIFLTRGDLLDLLKICG